MSIEKAIHSMFVCLSLIACGKASTTITSDDVKAIYTNIDGFKLTLNYADESLTKSITDGGELSFSLSGCEARTSQLLAIRFALGVPMAAIKLKSTSRLKDCTIKIDSLTVGGVRFDVAQKAMKSYVGEKSSVGLYISSANPSISYALIPSKKISFEADENLAKIGFTLVSQVNVGTNVVGEIPPLLTLADTEPLHFEGVDPSSGKGLFRVRFVCQDVSATSEQSSEIATTQKCEIPEVASQKLEDLDFLIAKRSLDGEVLLPDAAEEKFTLGAARVKKAKLPLAQGSQFIEVSSLLGEEVMSQTDKLWLLAKYTNSLTGAKSFAAWSIETEKLQ